MANVIASGMVGKNISVYHKATGQEVFDWRCQSSKALLVLRIV